jgi:3',5'-cyclic AMP phosphodiesterase CpdA
MARIAHLSDIHFGAHDSAVVAGAEAWLAETRPDLVVISGDFTQRARVDQYREAGAFLDRIEAQGLPTLGVPGNHDVRSTTSSADSPGRCTATGAISTTISAPGSRVRTSPCSASTRRAR